MYRLVSGTELQLRSYKEDRARWVDALETEEEFFVLRRESSVSRSSWRQPEILILGSSSTFLYGDRPAPANPTPPRHIDSLPKPR